jgi:hypothetical protein
MTTTSRNRRDRGMTAAIWAVMTSLFGIVAVISSAQWWPVAVVWAILAALIIIGTVIAAMGFR